MSKPKRKLGRKASPRPRKWLPLVILVLGLVLVGGTVLLVNRGDSAGSVSAEPALAGTDGPRMQVADAIVNYGDVSYNTPIETVFRVENVGDQPLEILGTPQVELVDGC